MKHVILLTSLLIIVVVSIAITFIYVSKLTKVYPMELNDIRVKSNHVITYVFRLESEVDTTYYKRTINSLKRYGYNYRTRNAINGVEMGINQMQILSNVSYTLPDITEELMNKTESFSNAEKHTLGGIGCWASHINIWRQSLKHNVPVISLEADTYATSPLLLTGNSMKYDILFIHNHRDLKLNNVCNKYNYRNYPVNKVGFATGALLFTNTRGKHVMDYLESKPIDLVIGHWLLRESKLNNIKVGFLCPAFFTQGTSHTSSIQFL